MLQMANCFLLSCSLYLTIVGSSINAAAEVGKNADASTVARAFAYLSKFGYTEPDTLKSGSIISEDSMNTVISDFQHFANLPVTGILDKATLEMMAKPRCGVKDKVGRGSVARKKRYALQGSRWNVEKIDNTIRYKFDRFSSQLDKEVIRKELQRAFDVWALVTPLKFTAADEGSNENVQIVVSFEKGEHGDGDPFDGVGGTLAHAYFPQYGGDAHFDDTEKFTYNSFRGTNLFQVAAHEFGHSLGLSHSEKQGSLMAPFYRSYDPNFKLHTDDVRAIQSLYGDGVGKEVEEDAKPSTGTGTGTGSENAGLLCKDPKFDAIVRINEELDCVFKGSQYWKLLDEGIAKGYPRNIADDFKGLPNDIDAAFPWHKRRVYFFKGSQYWRFTGFDPDDGYPKNISQGFRGIPDNVDTAFIWSGNNKIYFFKKSEYFAFDQERDPPVNKVYPKEVNIWSGIPNDIDGAFQYGRPGKTYFFKGDKYWRFNDRKFKVSEKTSFPYPRSTSVWWFGCQSELKVKAPAPNS